MAINAEQLNVILSARDREFTRAMDRAQRRVDQFSRQSNRRLNSSTAAFTALSGAARAFLPALSAGLVVQQVRRVVSELDEIGKKADAIGLTTDALQELRVVAEEAGVSQEALDNAMMQFSRRLGEARQGLGQARYALDDLNLSAIELASMPLDQALQTVAEAMLSVEDATSRTAMAQQLFGRSGVPMLNLLREGAAGMEAMRQNARDLGIVIDEDLIRSAEEAENQLGLMSRVIDANLSTALINLAPLLVGATTGIANLTTAARSFIDSFNAMQAEADVSHLQSEIETIEGLLDGLDDRDPDAAVRLLPFGGEEAAVARLAALRLQIANLQDEAGAAAPSMQTVEIGSPAADLSSLRAATAEQAELARLASLTAEERERARIEAEADALVTEALADLVGSSLTVESTNARQEAANLRQEYIDAATSASSILNPVEAVGGATSRAGAAADDAAQSYQEMLERIIQANPALRQLGFNAEILGDTMTMVESGMESAFMSMIDGTMSAKDAFKSMARDIIAQLYRVLVVQRMVGTFGAGGGGILGSIFGALNPTGAASGRSVQAGQPYVTGEHGRELFVPSSAGRVLSVSQSKDALNGGGGGVVVNQTINVSTGVQQTVRTEIKQLMPQIAESAKSAVVDAKRRGGSYGRAFS